MQLPSIPVRLQTMFDDWVQAESGRFALWLPVAMSAGAAAYFAGTAEPAWWTGLFALGRAMVLAVLLRRYRALSALAWLIAAASIGFAAAQWASHQAPPLIEVPRQASLVTGTIRAIELLPAGRRVLISQPHLNDGPALPRSLRIRLRASDDTDLQTGDLMRVRALLSSPAPPAYPGGWDLQRDNYFESLGAYGTALGPSELLTRSTPTSFLALAQALRETIAGRINASMDQPQASIAATLMTGLTASIPPDIRTAFRDSGLAHLLAIAGLHIGIVMGLVFAATRNGLAWSERATLFWPLKTIAAVAALLAGGCYLLLTGGHVPIIRSFAMAALATLGMLAGRRAISLRGLALAMAAIVLLAPNEVLGVSFQMSFSAVLALIVGYATLRPRLARLHGVRGHIVGLALTSALAGTFSAPYGAYHFGHIQVYYVLANMIAVPITALLVMPAGLLSLALMPLHLETLALTPMGWGISAIVWVARTVSALPAATLPVAHAPDWGLAAFSLGLAWLGLWRTKLRWLGLALMAAGLLSPLNNTLPDVLMSADGRLIGYRSHGQMLVQKSNGGAGFTQDAWQQYWNLPPPVGLDCASENCVLQTHPLGPSAILIRGKADASLCAQSLLISAAPIDLDCPETVARIDRFSVWREGAQAIWLGPGPIRIVTDRQLRGERPWVPTPPTAGRVPSGTTPALRETAGGE